MAIKFINEKEHEDRKREKRLVHMTNELGRGFIDASKIKAKAQRETADYIARSFLDFIFFEEHKEITELQPDHLKRFLTDYAPRKLEIGKENAKEVPEILISLVKYLETAGYLKNIDPLTRAIKEQEKPFAKIAASFKKKPADRTNIAQEPMPSKSAYAGQNIGRNDPCPCGSGKKYKKCHGKDD